MGQEGPVNVAQGTRRREAWLLSADDLLLIELGPMLGDRYRTQPVDTVEALGRASAAGWLLLLDVVGLEEPQALAARLATRYPQAPVIVFCADGDLPNWKNQPAARTVCAILERSAIQSPALAKALAEADRRLDAAATAATGRALPRLEENVAGANLRRPLPLIGLALAGGLAVAGYFWWRGHPDAARTPAAKHPAPLAGAPAAAGAPATAGGPALVAPEAVRQAPVAAPALAAPATPRSVEELLSDARSAFRDDRTQLPRLDGAPQGDSALELYVQVLRQDPKNDEALDGLRRLLAVTRDRVQGDLKTDRLDEASQLIAAYRNAGLAGDELAKMERDVNATRPRQLLQKARAALAAGDFTSANALATQAANLGADATQLATLRRDLGTRTADASLATLAAQARAAIAAGNLLEPAADSAHARLQAMQQSARGQPPTLAVAHELQQALLQRAQLAVHGNDPRQADPWLGAAAELGATPELLAAQRDQQAALEEQARRTSPATLAAAAAAAAAAKAAAAPGPTPAWFAAKPRRPLSVVYPAAALQRAQSGYVILEFTLAADGRANAPHVLESSPPRLFDAAALEAVRAARFDISAPAGQGPAGLRARLRVGFRFEDSGVSK
jgi:protein TonB